MDTGVGKNASCRIRLSRRSSEEFLKWSNEEIPAALSPPTYNEELRSQIPRPQPGSTSCEADEIERLMSMNPHMSLSIYLLREQFDRHYGVSRGNRRQGL